MFALAMASALSAAPALAQSSPNLIVPDGRTLTQTTNLGAVTEVTTGSVSGTHAFNSFSTFNVGAGGTVNLQLPAGTSTLFNVVRDAPIQIDGVLNSYRSGQIGGRVFFADPYGMVVGAGGVINTGSLSVSTPTSEFLDKMIAPNGTIDPARVADLEAGNVPISASGSLVVRGRINAQTGVALQGRTVSLGGDGRLFSSAVNTEGLDGGAVVVTEAGDIAIAAAGDLTLDGTLATRGAAGRDAGAVRVTAGGDITVGGNTQVSAVGQGAASAGGTIAVLAGGDLTLAKDARFDASAGASGDGGDIEISAKRGMTLNGGHFTAGAQAGRQGTLLFDPTDLTITAASTTPGVSVILQADNSITVAAGGAIVTSLTGGKAGDISITAPTINLVSGSTLNASALGVGGTAGNINLTATSSSSAAYGQVNAATAITLAGSVLATPGGVTDTGGAITVAATSSAISSYDTAAATGADLPQQPLTGLMAALSLTGLTGGYVAANAAAAITVAGTAVISGGPVSLVAANTATASDTAIGLGAALGIGASVVVGDVTSTATVAVQDNASITAVGALTIKATNNAKLDLAAYSVSSGQVVAEVTVAYSTASIQSSATVAPGALITVSDAGPALGAFKLIATNTNAFSTTAEADAFGGGKASIAVAIANGLSSTATATNGANLGTAQNPIGSVLIEADSITTQNVTGANSQTGNNVLTRPFLGAGAPLAGLTTLFSSVPNLSSAMGLSGSAAPKFGASVALTLDQQHTANASLGGLDGGARANIFAGQVTVSGQVSDSGVRSRASSGVGSSPAPTPGDPSATGAISAGIAYATYNHTATAVLDDVNVNAANIGVAATNTLPMDIAFIAGNGSWSDVTSALSTLKKHMDPSLGVVGTVLTSYANAASTESGLGFAGAVDYFDVTDTTRAWVGGGASLKSTATGATPAWSTSLDVARLTLSPNFFSPTLSFATAVTVQANALVDTIDVVGSPWNILAGPGGGGGAVGAMFGYTRYTSDTDAGIYANANVEVANAGLTVAATSADTVFAMALGAGKGAGTSLDGSLALVIMNESTHASISNGAQVTAASVDVNAAETLSVWSVSGDLTASTGATAAGVTGGVFQATTDTQAFVGDNSADRPPTSQSISGVPGQIATNDLDVVAVTAGTLGAAAVAATAATSSNPTPTPPTPATPAGAAAATPSAAAGAAGSLQVVAGQGAAAISGVAAGAPAGIGSAPATPSSTGLAIAGAAAIALPTLSTQAFLDGATVVNADVNVQARNNTFIDAGAGSVALTANTASNSQSSTSIGGVVAFQSSNNLTSASVRNGSNLTNLVGLSVLAFSGGTRTAVGVAGTVSASTSSGSKSTATGSVSLAEVNDSTTAEIEDSTVTANSPDASGVQVGAYNSVDIGIGGGSLAIGGSKGIGAAVTYASLGDGVGAASGASINGGSFSNFGSITVSGLDATNVRAGAADVAVSTDGNSLAGSVVVLDSKRTTSALIGGGATFTGIGAGGVVATAAAKDVAAYDAILTSDANGAVGAGSVDFSGASINQTLSGGSSIFAAAGAVQVGGNNVGLSWASAYLNDTHFAGIAGGAIATTGDVSAFAGNDTQSLILAVGVGGADGSLAGVGSVTINSLGGGTGASIGQDGTATTISADDVTVTATDTGSLKSLAGAVSIGIGGASAVGAAVAVAKLNANVDAGVSDVALTSTGDLTVNASTTRDIETGAVAVALSTGGTVTLSGAVTVNTIGGSTGAGLDGVTGSGLDQVAVTAQDSSSIQSLATGVAASAGSPAAGASVAVNDISNQITANIQGATGQVLAARDVVVSASTTATIKALAVGFAASAAPNPALAAGAGSVVVNTLATETSAGINGMTVNADDNVGVLASDQDEVSVIAGAASIGTTGGGVGVSVVVNDMRSTTGASISGATVNAQALNASDTLAVPTGALVTPIDTTTIQAPTDAPPDMTPATKTVTGVAVNATSAQAVTAISFAAALSAGASSAISADVATNIMGGSTSASVIGSSINQNAGAGATQQVDVNAASHTYSGTFVLGASGAVGNAGGAAIAVNKFDRSTTASITDSTTNALQTVTVGATGDQNVAAIAAGLGVGGGNAAAATGIINILSGDTQAYVTGGGVTASGLAVTAQTLTESSDLGGSIGIGAGVAIGATFDVVLSENTTLAYVGDAAEITTLTLSGPLTVTADTTSDFHDLGVSGALAGSVAISGMVSYSGVTDTTRAGLYNVTGALTAGDVDVTAGESLTLNQKLGGGAGGLDAGVGAAVVVDIIQSSVTAEIVDGSVTTPGDVNVTAGSDRDITAFSATGAAGLFAGVDAGVGVVLIGSGDTGGATGQLTGGGGGGTQAQVNSLTSGGHTQAFTDSSLVNQSSVNAQTTRTATGVNAAQPDLTVASISGATISAQDVQVAATNTTRVANTTGAGAAGAVGVGMGVGYVRVYGAVTAQIDDDATITTNSVSVVAAAQDGDDGIASDGYVGSAGLVGLGAVVADALVENTVTASLGGTISAPVGAAPAGAAVQVVAVDTSTVTTNTINGEVGGLAAGAAVSHAARTSTVQAGVDQAALTGYGAIDITADSSGAVTALATAVAGGAGAAGTGADAQATDSATVTASFDGASTIAGGGSLNLTAGATPDASAHALGVAVSGGLSVGVSTATATAAPTVTAMVADSANLNGAGTVALTATTRVPTGGESANARADAGTGGLLIGVDATSSTATYNGTVNATVGNNVTLPTAAVSIVATNNSNQQAATFGLVAGLLAAGGNASSATANAITLATLGSGTITTATRTGDLTISATGQDTLRANTTAGSGGLASGAAASATTSDTSTTTAAILDNASNGVIYGRDIVISAAHTADIFGVADSTQAAAVGYSGAFVNNTATGLTMASLGASIDLVGRNVAIHASTSTLMDEDGPSVTAGAGGAINGAAADSTTTIDDTTSVSVGAQSTLTALGDATGLGLVSLLAANNIVASDTVTLTSGGLAEEPSANSSIVGTFNNSIDLGAQSGLYSTGETQVGTYSLGNVSSNASVKTWGLSGVVNGQTAATLDGDQSIDIGPGTVIQSGGDLTITVGQSGDGAWSNQLAANAHTEAYNNSVIPASTPADAGARIVNDNTLTVEQGAKLLSTRDIVMGSVLGERSTSAKANGHTPYNPNFSIVNSTGNVGTSETAALVMDGQAVAGANYAQSLTIDSTGTVITALPTPGSGWLIPTYRVVNGFDPNAVLQAAINAIPAGDTSGQLEVLQRLQQFVPADPAGVGVLVGDLFASGGSITVDAQTVTASAGSLTANGGASITINNASADHLVLGRISIPVEPHAGEVIFTDPALAAAPIAGLTVAPVNVGVAPKITINDTFTGGKPAQIFLQGAVNNLSGDVILSNASGSVGLFNSLAAAAINITAPNGEAALICPVMCSVAGSVQAAYSGFEIRPQDASDAATLAVNAEWYSQYLTFLAALSGPNPPTPTYYGLTPGGFTGYLLSSVLIPTPPNDPTFPPTVGSVLPFSLGNDGSTARSYQFQFFSQPFSVETVAVVPTSTSLATAPAPTGASITSGIDAQAIAISAQIIDINGPLVAGSVLNSSVVIPAGFGPGNSATTTVNAGDRLLGVSYQNGQVVVSDAAVRGAGSIYLNGEIVSSNPSGSISVRSGQSNVTIVNNSGLALVVQDLNAVGGAVGEIQIVDQLKSNGAGAPLTTWYRYTADGGLSQYDNTNGGMTWETANLTVSNGAATTSYSPVAGTRLQWVEQAVILRSFKSDGSNWNDATVGDWTFVTTETSSDLAPHYRLGPISIVQGAASDPAFSQTVTATTSGPNSAVGNGWDGGGDFYMTIVAFARVNLTSTAKADYPIAIKFVGSPGVFDISSAAAPISLAGRISNATGTTNVTTLTGGITQASTASITSGALTLTGGTGIGTAAQPIVAELSGGALTATTSQGDINLVSRTGGITLVNVASLGVSAVDGSVQPVGDVTVSAAGALTGTAGATTAAVTGRNITLTAGLGGAGGIGTAAAPLLVQLDTSTGQDGGALNAGAADGIYLTQPTGDLTIDQIRSTNGDVAITALAGDVVSGLAATTVDPAVEAKLTSLVDGLNLANDTGQGALTSYGNSVIHAYNQYWAIRGQFTNPGSGAFDITGNEAMFARRVELLTGQFPASNALIASTMQGLYNSYASQLAQAPGGIDLTSFNPQFSYQVPSTDPLYAQLTRGASWTPAQLQLQVDSSALLPVADTLYLTQAPNIVGANVTITTPAGGVGVNTAPITFTVAANATSLPADQAAALAAADPGDTTITANADGSLAVQVRQEGFISVSATGATTVTASGDIYLASPGTLEEATVASTGAGDVRVRAGGSILSGTITTALGDLSLEAATGSLGFANGITGAALNLDINGSLISTRSGTYTYLQTPASSGLILGDMFAGGYIAIDTRFIESAFSDGQVRIEADTIALTTRYQIGTADSPLQIKLNGGTFNAQTSVVEPWLGDIYMNVAGGGPVNLGFVWGHDVRLSNPLGSFTITGAVEAANDLNLSAGSLFALQPTAAQLRDLPYWGAAIGQTVTLTASTGDIGSLETPFYLVASTHGRTQFDSVPLVTILAADAPQGSIYLEQRLSGDMTLLETTAQNQISLVVDDGDLKVWGQITLPQNGGFYWTASGATNINGCTACGNAPMLTAPSPTITSMQAGAPVGGAARTAAVNTDDDDEGEGETTGGSDGR